MTRRRFRREGLVRLLHMRNVLQGSGHHPVTPRSYSGAMDALVTIANVLFVSAYFVRDVLWLRALALAGASCLAMYFYSLPQPMMNVVYWNLVYVTINATWIARLAMGRMGSAMAQGATD